MTVFLTNAFTTIIQSFVDTYFLITLSKKISKRVPLDKFYSKLQIFLFFIVTLLAITISTLILKLNLGVLIHFRVLIMIFITFLALRFILKQHISTSILVSLSSSVFSAVVEIIATIFCIYVLKLDVNFMLNSNFGNLIIILLYCLISFILTFILDKTIKDSKFYQVLSKMSLKNIILFTFSLIFYIFPQMILFVSNKYNYPIVFLILNIIQFLFINIFVLIYVSKEIKYEKNKLDLYTSEIHNKALIGMVDGVRTLKHDYNNIIQSLNGYVLTKQYDKLEDYINSLLNECNSINNIANLNQDIFNDPAIYGVVGSKYFIATEKNIKFDFDISIDISSISFSMPDLSRILGIILDNAIEATLKTDEKYIRLQMSYDTRKNADVIKVFNTYDTNIQIDLNEIYKKGVSSKKVKSGIGLWEVKKLIAKSNNSQIYATIEKNKFAQNIIIEKNN